MEHKPLENVQTSIFPIDFQTSIMQKDTEETWAFIHIPTLLLQTLAAPAGRRGNPS